MNLLHLEDAVDDNPQALSLLSLHERDSQTLKKYIGGMQFCLKRVLQASEETSSSLRALAQHLHAFEQQPFHIAQENTSLIDILHDIAKYSEEMSSIYQVMCTQIGDNVTSAVNRFLQNDLEEMSGFTEMVARNRAEYEASLNKYLKLSKKRDSDKLVAECRTELETAQHRLELASLQHYSNLNTLQYSRSSAILEPLAGLLACHRTHFSVGQSTAEQAKDIANVADSVVAASTSKRNNYMQYTAQKTSALEQSAHKMREAQDDIPPETNLSTKMGYVLQRFKPSVLSGAKWEKGYLSIVSENLMWQGGNDIACSSLLDLQTDVKVTASEADDRRFVFAVSKSNRVFTFQAFSYKEQLEWISAINNASKIANSGTPAQSPALSAPSKTFEPDRSIEFEITEGIEKLGSSLPEESFVKIDSDGNLERKNPFASTETDNDDYDVRFLGSMQVNSDVGSSVILEAIRQVMAARAIKNVFKVAETKIRINIKGFCTIEQSDDSIRCYFPLSDIASWSVHPDNSRMFGIITRKTTDNGRLFHCHIFEANNCAQEIQKSLEKNTQIAYQRVLEAQAAERMKEKNVYGEQLSQ
ncbi:DgyrCDS2206 [Dimorphilus gyrociliatus]|uniref:DgyrCDS2206 n=1 Tax=Dimorphilus gyrociliatus TaxID=2664684 RepID=A0A7I8VCC6_9ANNE|nr:DgyrCDS2206 [Dimorphilus gyrociliatus]